jgi:hypothetical protein
MALKISRSRRWIAETLWTDFGHEISSSHSFNGRDSVLEYPRITKKVEELLPNPAIAG